MASRSGACTRVAPAPVVAVSPAHTLEYDCTACGSFLFGHRAHRLRPRPPPPRSSSSSNHQRASSLGEPNAQVSSSSNHQRASSLGEPNAQRILPVAGSTPPQVPQNEQSPLPVEHAGNATDAEVTSEAVTSVQASEEEEPDEEEVEEMEEVVNERVMDFVASPSDHSSSTLAEIFRCFICLGKVVDAQLCPCCSKLVCQPCIKRWLTDQKSECPHCRAPLLVSQLVSCRFISEISLEVAKIQGKLGDSPMEKQHCPTHDSPLLYFCTTCSVAVCSDCAVLIEDHRNHTFEKLSVAYGRHKKKIRMEAAGLRKRRKELSALVTSVDKNIETVLKSKDEAAAELQMAFKRMQSRLEEQLKCKLLALLAQKGSMTQEMELLDTILHELDQQLNSIPKSDLIAQEPNMSRMLQDIQTRTFSDISRTPISPEFTSEVVPSYEHGELILKNYKENLSPTRPTVFTPGNSPDISEVLLNKDVVYSEPICAAGVTWRLKVYPNGSGASQGTHLSVFLEMVEGGNEPANYEYGIDLLHRTRPNQRIIRKFSSDFEEGACWGYYQFFRIDLLEKEGYLQPDEDTITLRFYVRPLTYQQQCQDLRRSLIALQAERDESATQVAVIRRAFAAAFFQRRRRRSSRAGHEHVMFAQTVTNSNCMISSPMRKASAPHIPTMKQLQLKMQEYNNDGGGGGEAGNVWPQAEDQEHHHHSACTIESHELSQDQCANHEDIPNNVEDEDEAPSVELVDIRRKLQNPRGGRAQKKLRGRKVHKLTLLAPESATDTSEHLTGLSVVEAGPSATKMSENTANGDESSRENAVFSEPPVVETNALVEEEEKYPYYRSISGSSTNFCTPEIEDWGNLK